VRAECDRQNVAATKAIAGVEDPLAHPRNADLVRVEWSSSQEQDLTVSNWVVDDGTATLNTQVGIVADADIRVTPRLVIDACARADRLIVTGPDGASGPVVGFRLVHFESRNDRHILELVVAGHLRR